MSLACISSLCRAQETEEEILLPSFTIHTDTPETFEEAVIEALKAAKEDFANDKSRYIFCGLPTKKDKEFSELLRIEYKILPDFEGCVVTDSHIGFASTYNEMTRLLFLTKREIDLNEVYYEFFDEADEIIEPNKSVDSTPVSAPR